jgi:squalene-associated FAD-dependent desaturase
LSNARKLAVIGGGYAGLAAAVELARHNIPVTVFEAARQLGGRARRVEHQGLELDNGQHILIGAYQETLRMMTLTGVNTQDALLRLSLEFDLPGRFHLKTARLPAPLHLAWGLLTATGLTWSERISAARFINALRKLRFKLAQDITVAALLEQHRQSERTVQLLWSPLCIAALNTPIDTASAQVFLHVLRDSLNGKRQASDILLPRVDLSRLFPEPAAAFIEQHGGTVFRSMPVRAVEKSHSGYVLLTDNDRLDFTGVICATAPSRLSRLLNGLPELASTISLAENLRFQPICTIYLQYPVQVHLPKPMIGFADGFAQWAFDRGQLHNTHGLIAVVISATGKHTDLSHEQLAEQIHLELCNAIGTLPAPLWHKVITEKRATFSCDAGLARPRQDTPLRGLFLAGDYTEGDYPATLEGAIRSGVKSAKLILDKL